MTGLLAEKCGAWDYRGAVGRTEQKLEKRNWNRREEPGWEGRGPSEELHPALRTPKQGSPKVKGESSQVPLDSGHS